MKKTAFKIFEFILCIGLFVGVIGYYRLSTSAEFNPTAARDFNRNIVEAKNNQKKESEDATEGNLWKKDENSLENESSGSDNTSDYTKKNEAEEAPQDNNQQTIASSTVTSTEETTQDNTENSDGTTEEDQKTADTVYDIVDGKDNTDKKPDIIIPSDDDHNNKVPAGKDDKDDNNGGTVIIKPGDNNNTNIPGGNDTSSSKPEYVPTKDIKDPELVFDSNKKGDGNIMDPNQGNVIFKDDIVSDVTDDSGFSLMRIVLSVSDSAFYQLFKGGTFSDKYVFYSLDTYILDLTDFFDSKKYYFMDDTYGPDGNFMITGVSLDDGNTWITEFPFTVPENQEIGVKVKYAYRFSTKGSWTEKVMGEDNEYADQYLPVYESRIFVLNQQINEDKPVISTDMILNPHDQYNHVGDTFYLYRFQEKLFKANGWIDENGYNTVLFPGWVEDGKTVDRYYTVAKGRHVFQPINTVSVPDGFKVKLKSHFDTYDNLEYFQTLTSFDNASLHSLVGRNGSTRTVYVPEYVQSIDLDQGPSSTCAWMEIPDTVMYINDNTAPLYVTDGFIVDENNPYYTSSEDGLLLSKDETEILGIPSGKTSITIQPGIKAVHFTAGSSVKEITILANSMDEMPELDLSRLSNATLHVQSSIMSEFINENHDVLESSGISISSIANEDLSYIFDNDLQIGSDNGLYHSFSNAETLVLSNTVSSVKSGAFEGTSTSTLILPEDGTVIHFESGSLKSSSVQTVICYTKKQEEEITAYLNKDGLTGIKVVLSAMSADGNYQYYAEDGVYTLVKAFNSPEVYDGSLTLDNGETVYVSEIAGGAFKGNTTLKTVNLNESVKKIGTQAFMNCTNLESLMINSTDIISIGDKAVDGCDKLRFMASNAYEGIMENNYAPQVYNMGGDSNFYIPTGAEGYNNAIYFTPESGVFGYTLIDNSLLYGCDMTLQPWLLISASHASGTVNIDPGTIEIYSYAFTGLTDKFTVPFENLDPYSDFVYIDAAAFENSGITDVTIDKSAFIYDQAFFGCANLNEFTVNGNVTLEDQVLMQCPNLEKVTFGKLFSNSLRPDMFNGCNKLSELNLNGYYDYYDRAPSLMVWEYQNFRFNTEWETEEDEIAHLKINLGEDIDVDDVVNEWRYGFLGYTNIYNSAYIELWNHCKSVLQLTLEDGKPTDEQVDELVESNLLEAENRIRRMVGSEKVEEPVPYILYSQLTSKVDNEVTINSITIRGTSGPMEYIDLDDRMDLPVLDNVFYDFVIRENVFVNSPNLSAIFLPNSFTVLQDGFLSGVQSEGVGIWNMSGPIPELEIKEEGVPFSFGVEDEKVSIICLNDKEGLLKEWQYALVGYSSEETFKEAMTQQLKEEQPELEENSEEFEEALKNKEDEKLQIASDRMDTIFTGTIFDK